LLPSIKQSREQSAVERAVGADIDRSLGCAPFAALWPGSAKFN